MKNLSLLLFLLMTTIVAFAQDPVKQPEPDEQQGRWATTTDTTAKSLIAMEREWAEEACTGKIVVQGILAEDFQGTSPDGTRYSKQEAVERASTIAPHDCRLIDAKVHFFGDNTALVYGSESSVRKGNTGQNYTRTLVWTDTWLKRNGRWQIVAAQDVRADCK
jgi:hypothetical protein